MRIRHYLLGIIFIFANGAVHGQKWVDTAFTYQQVDNIVYGNSYDFAGNFRTLTLNIATPANDTVPMCGRPLLLAIHGGAFIAGNKDIDAPPQWIRDFAKRGYVCASINYRLGQFNPAAAIHCNVPGWDCLNMQDTAEWYRAAFRGMQDAKGAIRYMINNASTYQIDARNVFVVGESAGGFIALEVAFLDMPSEKFAAANAITNALPPNTIYENQCIQSTGFDTSIASMLLDRQDLGSIDGDLNLPSQPYTIKGVGSFYGALFSDLFSQYQYTQSPGLYLFHQPNDLVVPYQYGQIEGGVSLCATQFPAFCQSIVSLPLVYGSKGIVEMLNNLNGGVAALPTIYFDSTLNTADCIAQALNPSLTGHAIDNYGLRTLHLAQFFAGLIDTGTVCNTGVVSGNMGEEIFGVFPNPADENFVLQFYSPMKGDVHLQLYNLLGNRIWERQLSFAPGPHRIYVDKNFDAGVYFLQAVSPHKKVTTKIIVH